MKLILCDTDFTVFLFYKLLQLVLMKQLVKFPEVLLFFLPFLFSHVLSNLIQMLATYLFWNLTVKVLIL